MNKIYLITILSCCTLAAGAGTPDYDRAVTQVLAAGYGIKADSLRMEASRAALEAENVPEGPEAEFEYLWPATAGERNRWSAGISQSFDWPGAYAARRSEAAAMSDASRAVLRADALDKALQAKLLIIDIVNARRRLAFYRDMRLNVAAIDSLTRRSFALENATVLDTRKTRVALLDIDRSIATAQADIDVLESELAAMGAEAADWVEYPEQTAPAPVAPESLPQMMVAQAQARLADATQRSIRRQAMPGFSLGYRHAFEDGNHFNGLSVAVRLPSWSTVARRRSAELEAAALAHDNTAAVALATAENTALYRNATSLLSTLDSYRELTGDNSYLELLLKAFDGGQLSVIDYLNEINIFKSVRLEYIDLEYRYNTTLARLNRSRSVFFK